MPYWKARVKYTWNLTAFFYFYTWNHPFSTWKTWNIFFKSPDYPGKIQNLRCLKEHAQACGGVGNVVVTKAMIKGMAEEVKRLKMERELKDEAVRSRKLKEDEEK